MMLVLTVALLAAGCGKGDAPSAANETGGSAHGKFGPSQGEPVNAVLT